MTGRKADLCKGCRKYDADRHYRQLERGTGDEQKALSATIFYDKWKLAEADEKYHSLKNQWKNERG